MLSCSTLCQDIRDCSCQFNSQVHFYCIGQFSLLRLVGKRQRHIRGQTRLRTARGRAIYITSGFNPGHSRVCQMEQSLYQLGRAQSSLSCPRVISS